ncbi:MULTISPECIES: SDR family oxidoreductase [unclassified Streptomyces]|uniref:SDR family oxidoreductase n=2 Tax=Streptomyces TaxID=1883 RepID=UPI002B1CC03F|nr:MULTISPECIES: SDR family oxidoreductase [unclassified Streptomyces]
MTRVATGITDNGNAIFKIPEARERMSQLSAFKRVGEPEDVADVVTFLSTDQARWITGAFIDATGGGLLGQTGPPRHRAYRNAPRCLRRLRHLRCSHQQRVHLRPTKSDATRPG